MCKSQGYKYCIFSFSDRKVLLDTFWMSLSERGSAGAVRATAAVPAAIAALGARSRARGRPGRSRSSWSSRKADASSVSSPPPPPLSQPDAQRQTGRGLRQHGLLLI